MEPLSKPITDWLLTLNLCTKADLRRCRGRVRQLARDVPAFDSLWIDALVHARKLTPFQAKLLESGHLERLAVGPCVLLDQLGHGMSTTYLARLRDKNERCVLKRLSVPTEQRGTVLDSLSGLVERTKQLSHPSVIAPRSCLVHHEELVVVSRHVVGPSLSQLLVRRGRFPARIVLALAKQLIDALAALEACEAIHGDVRLPKLRLAASGLVTMVDAGIAPAIRPELNIHARTPPEHYDGIAPELISTGNHANAQSEFYALGCLLWQLLAGRPPFPTGDPLAKLMAHQTRRIPDVRTIAPDTPAELADILSVFTEPDPARRPPSFRAFRARWGPAKRTHRKQIRRFRAMFNTAIGHLPSMTPEASSGRGPMVAALLFVLSGASFCLMDAGAYSRLLSLSSQVESYWNASTEPEDSADETPSKEPQPLGKPLPAPNANGVIELTESGPYRVSQINAVGPLTIRGVNGVLPEIVIEDAACQLSATDVVLENIQLRALKSSSSSPLLSVRSRTLVLRKCGFVRQDQKPNSESASIRWRHIDPNQPVDGRVLLENCLFTGEGIGCQFTDWPRQVVIVNCLKTHAGVMLDFAETNKPHRPVQLDLSQVTLRGASGLSRCSVGVKNPPGSWLINAKDCVFALDPASAGLFQVRGPSPGGLFEQLQMQGRQCLLTESASVAGFFHSETKTHKAIDAATLNVEGLVFARVEFAGSLSFDPQDSQLTDWQGPRFSSSSPGVNVRELPQYNSPKPPTLSAVSE